jgi:hypothetical protein
VFQAHRWTQHDPAAVNRASIERGRAGNPDPRARLTASGAIVDDAAAYMLLATSNEQGELSTKERGRHALKNGMEVRSYADKTGRSKSSVDQERCAAEVAEACPHVWTQLKMSFVPSSRFTSRRAGSGLLS